MAEVSFTTGFSALVPLISGGNRVRSIDLPITISGAASYDPDYKAGSSASISSFKREWQCVIVTADDDKDDDNDNDGDEGREGMVCPFMLSGEDGGASNAAMVSDVTSASLVLPAYALSARTVYRFTLCLECGLLRETKTHIEIQV